MPQKRQRGSLIHALSASIERGKTVEEIGKGRYYPAKDNIFGRWQPEAHSRYPPVPALITSVSCATGAANS
jgi:hypothetical protein